MSELLKVAVSHVLYLAFTGFAMWSWLRWVRTDLTLVTLLICALPALVGLALALTSTADSEQYIMRLVVAGMFLPILLLFWGSSQEMPAAPTPAWAYAVGAAVLHAAAFVGCVFWLGTALTRVSAQAGATPVTSDTLQARLLSLNNIAGPLDVATEGANHLVVSFRFKAEDRSHRVLLDLNGQSVRVRERLSTRNADPVSFYEASMRGPGDPAIDATRPAASKVFSLVAQTSTIYPEKLKAVPVLLQGRAVAVAPEFAVKLDGDGMVNLLCAIVTRSGWNWEPAFFGSGE